MMILVIGRISVMIYNNEYNFKLAFFCRLLVKIIFAGQDIFDVLFGPSIARVGKIRRKCRDWKKYRIFTCKRM